MRDRRIRRVHLAGQHIDRRQIPLVTDPDLFEPLGILVVGQELSRAELRRPLEGHTVFAFTRPLALEIRVAPRRPLDPLSPPVCVPAARCAMRCADTTNTNRLTRIPKAIRLLMSSLPSPILRPDSAACCMRCRFCRHFDGDFIERRPDHPDFRRAASADPSVLFAAPGCWRRPWDNRPFQEEEPHGVSVCRDRQRK